MSGFSALGCEVCGAVNSSLGLGTIAQGNRHSLGFSYQYRSYRSTHPRFFSEPETVSYEQYQRFDLLGTIRLSERWQAKLVLPYACNRQQKTDSNAVKSGIGDPTVTFSYFLIDRQDSTGTRQVRWSVGAGAKFPFGKFAAPHDPVLLLYPGTGSLDPVAQSVFLYRKNNWGLIQELNGIYRFSNKYNYTPGSVFNAALFGFRNFGQLSVFSGLQYAWNGIDYVDSEAIASSPARGNLLTAAAGISWRWNELVVQGNVHVPLVQGLGGGMVKQLQAVSLSFNYFL